MDREARADCMPHWTFFGRILPERMPLRVDMPAVTMEFRDFGLIYDMQCNIADSQFLADITVTKGAVDIHTLRNCVERSVRIATDLIGYVNGLGLDVEVISTVCRDSGDRCIFGPVVPILSQRRGGVFATAVDSGTYDIVFREVSVQIVLANFREAVRIPIDTSFYCYRAIEAMMQSVRLNANEAKQKAWDRLRVALNVERSVIDFVKGSADTARHGRPSAITDHDRAIVFKTTDELIGRYLAYLTRRKSPLPIADFPQFLG